jgi:ferric-dicitrate binding protein FerR (iron transport regulator)
MQVVNNVDVDAVVAWKNGNFSFKDATIETIMRNAQRWYNVEVKYQGTIKQTFEGEIPRKVPLQSLLKILESTDRIHFKVEGRTIIVMP